MEARKVIKRNRKNAKRLKKIRKLVKKMAKSINHKNYNQVQLDMIKREMTLYNTLSNEFTRLKYNIKGE